MKNILFCLLIIFLAICCCARSYDTGTISKEKELTAQPTPVVSAPPKDFFEQLIAKQKARIKSCEFMFDGKVKTITGMPSFQNGLITFREPDSIKMDLNVSGQHLIVIYKNEISSTLNLVNKTLAKLDLKKLPEKYRSLIWNSNPVNYFLGRNLNFLNTTVLGTENVGNIECFVMEVQPPRINLMEDVGEIDSERIWIGRNDGLNYKVILYDKVKRPLVTYQFGNVKINMKVPDSTFTVKEKDVKIIDITAQVLDSIAENEKK